MSSAKLILAGVIAAATVLGVSEWRSGPSKPPAPSRVPDNTVQQRPVAPPPTIVAAPEPARPPSETTAPVDRIARDQETVRLLAAVNSRESALVILDRVLEKFADDLPAIPEFKVLMPDDMEGEAREEFLASLRRAAAASQDLILVQEPDGQKVYYGFPREQMPVIIPREARPYLTPEDVMPFQRRVNDLSIIRNQARRAAAKPAPATAP